MDFNLNSDFKIFDELLQKRPEIKALELKKDLERYYLPFAKRLVELKKQKSPSEGVIVGISAIQGAGKTTQGEILDVLLTFLGYETVSLSIDDHYITHKELCVLREKDPRFIRRGVTHDKVLAILNLRDLKQMGEEPIIVSGYDKGANSGDGERFRFVNPVEGLLVKAKISEKEVFVNKKPQSIKVLQIESLEYKGVSVFLPNNMGVDVSILEPNFPADLVNFLQNKTEVEISVVSEKAEFSAGEKISVELDTLPSGWELVIKKPDFIFYDGWMLGVRQIEDESVFDQNLPALEKEEDKEFAKVVNKKLADYEPLWEMLDFLHVLYVADYQDSLKWRDQAEEALRAKGEGMSKEEIVDFVHYFWRSVHPAIHIKRVAEEFADQIVVINSDHSIGDILTRDEFKERLK